MLSEGLKKKIVNGIRFLIMKLPLGIRRDWALRWTRLFVILKIVNCFLKGIRYLR